MNRQEFEDTARRYREELFRMYASQNIDPVPKPEQAVPAAAPASLPPAQNQTQPEIPQPSPASQTAPVPQTVSAPQAEPAPQSPPASEIPQSPPEQDVPEPLAAELPADHPPQTEPPKRAYTGIIRVHVATARGAMPVPGATVIITHITEGEPELVSLQTTNASGNITPVTVTAPPPSADQRHPQSFLYDITAQAAGYYREHSTDVPVFPNITSMQNFDLIPLPAGTEQPVSDGDITYYNNMQQY